MKTLPDWLWSRLRALRERLMNFRFRGNGGKRVLVHEILSMQVFTAAIFGGLAIASLYFGGQWVLQDNYSRWALQWTEELNELAAPLYLAEDSEARFRLESFVERYPEIDRVSYFGKDGSTLFNVGSDADLEPVADLGQSRLEDAVELIGQDKPYLLQSGFLNPRQFEILAPVWTESMAEDDLFGFDANSADARTQTHLLGFVGIQLDFMIFHDRLLNNIKGAVLVLMVLIFVFALFGRHVLRRALSSISDLQAPIQELAKGNLGVKFNPAEHREISDIVEALETTATALSERDAKLLDMANHDSLTSLFNRRRFVEELKQETIAVMNKGHMSAVLFVDLDQFKYINDSCGHQAGDRLIRKVADELVRSVRADDVVARFGGDEFAILVRKTTINGAQSAAETILANMRRMAHVEDGQVFHIHCSIGIAMMDGDHLYYDDLINKADIACRDAKTAGRNRAVLYAHSDETLEQDAACVGWVNQLRNALDDDGFELRFQPINDIHTGETTHHEVLIRLRGEDGKIIPPDAFLTSAARFGMMSEIDFWIIENAAKAYAHYLKKNNPLKLSINVSANAFESDDLVQHVREVLDKYDVNPNDIIFEITESLAVRHPPHVEQQISAIRELGCEFALDDFGTGYSSFSYLQQLQFDYIKIDGTFVVDLLNKPVDQKMIKLIAEIGHEAGMKTIAEYVQDAESLALLEELGVDLAQGFFVGKPVKVPRPKPTPISLGYHRLKRTHP
ncbi:MAG: EAL domain-containing protein [Gammaproteobacteria bacterium]|nr:EAL domain-containing protein [Gammaproteobacteria bacterium]